MQKNCFVCKTNIKKYKCPKCKIFYCSLQCNNTHKSECQKLANTTIKNSQQQNSNPTLINYQDPQIIKSNFIEDQQMRVPDYKLKQLKQNQQLIKMLKDPYIRNMLLKIDNSKERITQLQRAMQNQEFLRMADTILDVVSPDDDDGFN